jgi:hypothetical protein
MDALADEGDLALEMEALDTEAAPPDFDRENELVPLVKRATYRFDGRASSVQEFVLAQGVDASRMRVAQLVMLVHERANFTISASLRLIVENVSFTAEEPDVAYVETGRAVAQSTAIQAGTPAVPYYEVQSLTPPIGGQLRVRLRFSQGASASTGFIQVATLSVYLMGRTRL